MAGTYTVTVQYTTSAGTQNISITGTIATPDGTTTNPVLASGFNSITVPTTTTLGILIIPPSGNTQTLTLKGVTGDTGIPLSKTIGNFIPLNAAALPATIGITAGGATSNPTTIIFI